MRKRIVIAAVVLALMLCVGCSGSQVPEGQVQVPLTSSSAEGKNYQDVLTQFEKAGFTAVETEGLGDLVLGFLHSEGEVSEVSIDGDVSYGSDAWFAPDAKVVIRYHSYPSSESATSAASSEVAASEATGNEATATKPDDSASASSDASASDDTGAQASDYVGKTAAEVHQLMQERKLSAYYYDSDGKELTDVIENGSEKASVRKAEVEKVEQKSGLFGTEYVEITLKYSAKKKMKAAKGESAAKAASIAKNNGYSAEFLDKSGDDVTEEVTGSSPVKAAKNATVTGMELRSGWGDTATMTLDYGVSKTYKTALRKAQSYVDNMHLSKARLYDQLTSEYGEQYDADAAQYAVDNVDADWNENALAQAKSYQENLDMSPAAIYDQLVSEYGEQFTPEEAQYAIDHL